MRIGKQLPEQLIDFFAADEDTTSAARTRWSHRLAEYVNRQGPLDAIRLRPVSDAPWPADKNPMYSFLLERSSEIATECDLDTALQWLGRNAWLEGCLSERTRVLRAVEED